MTTSILRTETPLEMAAESAVNEPKIRSAARLRSDSGRGMAHYRQALRKTLRPEVFKPNPWRLVWYFGCLGSGLACFLAITLWNPAWPIKLALGLALGAFNGTLGFVFHELSHGSIVSNKRLRSFLGFFGTLPYLTSPTYWAYSHDRLHHSKAQKLIEDPDAFPTLRIFRNSKFAQFMFPFTPGSGHRRSLAYFFFWFSFHNVAAQVYLRFRNRIYDSMDHRRVTIEFVAQVAIVGSLLAYAGPSNWPFVLLLPVMIQNYMLMSYISTNHNLSPLTSDNDPLVNSLTVTNHPILEWLNLNFGYHVEHHLFPTVNGKYAKAVHRELLSQFPETYQSMRKAEAIRRLYKTPRIYKNAHELVHPRTLIVHPTL